MTTATDVAQDSLEKLGIYAPGETIAAADASRCLTVLNDMLDHWADEYLSAYSLIPTTIALVIGQSSYTIGTIAGTSINQQRPTKVNFGPGAALLGAVPINVVSAVEWQAIQGLATQSGTPDTLFYDPQYPIGVLNVAPKPVAGGNLVFQAWTPLRSFPDLTTSYTLAAGVDEALKTNLAVVLQSYFSGANLSPMVVAAATLAKQSLRHSNSPSKAYIGRAAAMVAPQVRNA